MRMYSKWVSERVQRNSSPHEIIMWFFLYFIEKRDCWTKLSQKDGIYDYYYILCFVAVLPKLSTPTNCNMIWYMMITTEHGEASSSTHFISIRPKGNILRSDFRQIHHQFVTGRSLPSFFQFHPSQEFGKCFFYVMNAFLGNKFNVKIGINSMYKKNHEKCVRVCGIYCCLGAE